MTRGDRLLVLLVAVAVLVSVPLVSLASSKNSNAISVDAPGGRSSISLAHDGTYVIEGRSGRVVIEVAEGTARSVDAQCPDQLCVRMGEARPGRPIVCAPNGVSVSLGWNGGGALDAVSR